jgi:hypothetical protein
MAAWWLDKVLPGLVTSSICAAVMWLSHRKTRRHIDTVTKTQSEHIDRLTAEQTAALKEARKMPARTAKRLLEDYPGPQPKPPQGP